MKTPVMTSGWTQRLQHAAVGGVLGLVVLTAFLPSAARADDDDDNTSNSLLNMERKFWSSTMRAIGLRNGSEDQIDYRERSPLVLPPSNSLPAPDTTGSVSKPSPAWPDDPDVKRKA